MLGDNVYGHIGALRGKNRGNQQLKRALVNELAIRFRISFVQPLQNRANPCRIRPAPKRYTTRGFSPPPSRASSRSSPAARRSRRAPRSLSRHARSLLLVFLFCFGHQAEEYITRRALRQARKGRASDSACKLEKHRRCFWPPITNHQSLITAFLTPRKINSAQTATPHQATAARNETPSAGPFARLPKGYICVNSPSRSSRPRANRIAAPPPESSPAARPSTANAFLRAARTRHSEPHAQIAADRNPRQAPD